MWSITGTKWGTRRQPISTCDERAVPAGGRAPRERRAIIPRSGILRRAGSACPAGIKSGAPKGPVPFGAWNGWYVVHYGDQVGYAAAAYIDV